MVYSFLSGGTGTPKLLQGFREIVERSSIHVISNTGDDFYWNGLFISPDVDTLLYLFSGKLDTLKFWGRKNETFEALDTIKSLGLETWFNIGDKDLGLHIFRSKQLGEKSLTEICGLISQNWGISEKVFPMSNNLVPTKLVTKDGTKLGFQEYFVKLRTQVSIEEVIYEDSYSAKTTPEIKSSLDLAKQIIIGPSNPVTSIGPITAIKENREMLIKYRSKVTAVSPIQGDQAFSGPTTKLMASVGIKPSLLGLAEHYQKFISKLVIDPLDIKYKSELEDLGIEVLIGNIRMNTLDEKVKLSQLIYDSI